VAVYVVKTRTPCQACSSGSPIFNFSYHAPETVDKVLSLSGFEVVNRHLAGGGRMFVIARKGSTQ
jgi:hypothetical protein